MSNLQKEISGLSAAEKFDLLDLLWESIEADAPGITAEESAEIDRRVARYEQDPTDVIPWENVKARLFKKQ